MRDLLLAQTKGGLLFYELIFSFYNQTLKVTGDRAKNLYNPFYKDSKASFSIYFKLNTKRWYFKDYGDPDFSGDVFDFAALHYGLDLKIDFEEILDSMYNDLLEHKDNVSSLSDNSKLNPSSAIKEHNKKFEVSKISFTESALNYFSQYNIPIEILEENRVCQLEAYRYFDKSNKEVHIRRKNDELIFAFMGDDFAKIYHPNPKRFIYMGNKPKDYEFGLRDYGMDEIVILTAGEKDVLTLKSLGYNAFCLSNEGVDMPRYMAKDIYSDGAHVIIIYDIDKTGLRESKRLSDECRYPRIILPNELAEMGGKDISDWIKLGLPKQKIHDLINETIELKIKKHATPMQSNNLLVKEENTVYEIVEQNTNNANNAEYFTEENSFQIPVEVFPVEVQEIITSTCDCLKYPQDFISAALLGAASAAVGKSHKVKVKEGWYERPLIYMAFVARAGTNKSHPLSFALKPVHDRDEKLFNEFKSKKEEYDKIMGMSVKERKEKNIYDVKKPFWLRNLVTDITIEGLVKVHNQNIKGITLYADELAGWIKNFNKYHKGSDQEFWLSNWNGKPITVDRVSSDPIFIADSYVSVLGTIQPFVLKQLGKNELSRNGFIDRILFVIPDNIKKEYLNIADIDPEILRKWTIIISKLLNTEMHFDADGKAISKVLRLSSDALKIYNHWHKYNTDICNNEENEVLASVFSKLDMYVIRLALILEMLHWACNNGSTEEIQTDSMNNAVKLIEYFRKNAIKANKIINNHNPLDELTSNRRELYGLLPNSFSTAEAIKIASEINIPEKTLKNFIRNKELFENVDHGKYKKRIQL